MNIFGAIASGISIPIAIGFGWGWQGALGVWGILSILGVLFWIPQVRHRSHVLPTVQQKAQKTKHVALPACMASHIVYGAAVNIILCMITWLPEVLTTQGISVSQAGWFYRLCSCPFYRLLLLPQLLQDE